MLVVTLIKTSPDGIFCNDSADVAQFNSARIASIANGQRAVSIAAS
jgi:hypothetical protein